MTKTKHSLLMSVIALILCASMLIGTTFAWFTDSVTSSSNIIKSGTLSISLSYIDDINENPQTSTAWKNVEEAGVKNQIFDYSNWEPGFTQIRHIKIENEGSLALKYLVNFVPKDKDGNVINDLAALKIDGVSLADVIDVYYFDPAVQIDGREDLEGIAPLGTLSEVLAGLATSAQGTLEKDGKDIITLALKMKESAGNDYQDKTVGASFDIQLFATQLNSEKDSIDENYDKASTYPASTTEKVKGDDAIKAGDVAVTLPAGLPEANYTLDVDNTAVTTDANGDTTASFEIELYKDGVKVEPVAGVEYEVEIYVGKSLNVAEVTHNGTPVTPFDYNATTGIVSFVTDSFSPFTVTYYSSEVESAEDIEAIVAKGGIITLTDNVTLENGLVIDKDVEIVLDLGGKTIESNLQNFIQVKTGKVTIKNGTIKNNAGTDSGESRAAIALSGDAEAEIKDVVIEAIGNAIVLDDNAKITELNAKVTAYCDRPTRFEANAIYLRSGNARIDLISGGEYVSAYTQDQIDSYAPGTTYMPFATIHIDGSTASIGEISGGTFLGNSLEGSAAIRLDAGKIEKISGGYFGYCKNTMRNSPYGLIAVYNDASLDAITGGTFEYANGFKCNFENIVKASGSTVQKTEDKLTVTVKLTSSTKKYDVTIWHVVPEGYTAVKNADGTWSVVEVTYYDATTMGGLYELLPTLEKGTNLVLPEGTYNMSGTFTVADGVRIMGENGKTVVFHQSSSAQDDIFNCAGDAIFENITFESNRKGYAITDNTKDHDTKGNITVRNCKFVGLATEKNYGVYKNMYGNLVVENCTFDNYNNAICGVKNLEGSTTTIKGCTFTNINGEAVGYVIADVPADFETEVIANNTGLTAENVIGYPIA